MKTTSLPYQLPSIFLLKRYIGTHIFSTAGILSSSHTRNDLQLQLFIKSSTFNLDFDIPLVYFPDISCSLQIQVSNSSVIQVLACIWMFKKDLTSNIYSSLSALQTNNNSSSSRSSNSVSHSIISLFINIIISTTMFCSSFFSSFPLVVLYVVRISAISSCFFLNSTDFHFPRQN